MGNLMAARVQRLADLARSRCRPPEPAWANDLRHAVHTLLAAGCAPEDAAAMASRIATGQATEHDRRVITAADGAARRACGSVPELLRLVARVDALT